MKIMEKKIMLTEYEKHLRAELKRGTITKEQLEELMRTAKTETADLDAFRIRRPDLVNTTQADADLDALNYEVTCKNRVYIAKNAKRIYDTIFEKELNKIKPAHWYESITDPQKKRQAKRIIEEVEELWNINYGYYGFTNKNPYQKEARSKVLSKPESEYLPVSREIVKAPVGQTCYDGTASIVEFVNLVLEKKGLRIARQMEFCIPESTTQFAWSIGYTGVLRTNQRN